MRLTFVTMKTHFPIRLKAVFLIVVFLLNTVIGFACTTGIGVHMKAGAHHLHQHKKDNCCKEEVTKLTKGDKLLHAAPESGLQPLSFIHLNQYSYIGASNVLPSQNTSNTQLIKPVRPPIPDVRIAIQSFQI